MNENIRQYYQNIRKNNEEEREKRVKKLHSEIPELKEVDAEIKKILVNMSMLSFDVDVDAEMAIEMGTKKLKELRLKRAVILTDNDYMPDYLDDIYTCKLCKDKGFLDSKPCECYKKIELEEGTKLSNLYHLMKKENFDNFDFSLYSDEEFEEGHFLKSKYTPNLREYMYSVVDCLKSFISDDSLGAYIYGDTGVGKTFLCSSVCRYAIEDNLDVEYYSMRNFVDIISDYRFNSNLNFGENREEYKRKYDRLYDCEILILDDLGTEIGGKHVVSELFYVINQRFGQSKKTLISSNIALEEISDIYEERIASRILGNYLHLPIIGRDLRL